MAEGQFKEGIAGGRLSPARIRRQFFRPASAARPSRGAGRVRPLLFLLRRALHECLPDRRSTSRCSSARSRPAIRSARPRRSSTRTSWAACAPASARPRRCARRPACARSPRASRCRSAGCSATPPTSRWQQDKQFYQRAAPTGRKIAVVGAGPAGLAAAHRLARYGHDVTIFEARPKAGGLNEYGIAAYKSTDDFAQAEVDYVTAIGGIAIETRQGARPRLHACRPDARATTRCSSAWASAASTRCAPRARTPPASTNAVEFIAELRQAEDLAALPVGRRVVVIGGGMTAIDAAVQSKLLGAEEVTICYRRGQEQMNASDYEQDLAHRQRRHHPPLAAAEAGDLARTARSPAIELEYTALTGRQARRHRRDGRRCRPTRCSRRSARRSMPATLNGSGAAIALEDGRIKVDARRPHLARQSLGRRRLRLRRRRPHRLGRRAGPRRGRKHPPGTRARNGRA